MKRLWLVAILFIIVAILSVAWAVSVARASTLQDFTTLTELEDWLGTFKMVALQPDTCIDLTESLIHSASLSGDLVNRFTITSPDYYRYWYGQPLPSGTAHRVGIITVDGRPYLVEPLYRASWELTVGWAGLRQG